MKPCKENKRERVTSNKIYLQLYYLLKRIEIIIEGKALWSLMMQWFEGKLDQCDLDHVSQPTPHANRIKLFGKSLGDKCCTDCEATFVNGIHWGTSKQNSNKSI